MPHANLARAALRRGTLAASLLDDIPVEPTEDGVRIGHDWTDRKTWVEVPWSDLVKALGDAAPLSVEGRLRLRDWLRAVGELTNPQALTSRVVALALPRGHALHPGKSWPMQSILGGVLDLGLGLRPIVDQLPDGTPAGQPTPLPLSAIQRRGVDPAPWWAAADFHRTTMAQLAVDRIRREGIDSLRPLGGCDVFTLLSSPVLRSYLCESDGTGLRAVAVPMRDRGWVDLARIDPAYVGSAATATEPERRGLSRPLLITTDEVTLSPGVRTVAQQAQVALSDHGAHRPGRRRPR